MSDALKDYEAAYLRLKSNKPKICDKGTPINIATVAKEAGRSRSALRKGRGYDDLIERIRAETEAAGESNKRSSTRNEDQIKKLKDKVEQLAKENSLIKSQNLSLLMAVHAMETQLKQKGETPRKLIQFSDFKEEFTDIDVETDF